MRRLITAAIFLLGNAAPALAQAPAALPIEKEIVYTKIDGVELKLDLCRPKGDGPFPLVVCIHGGGWVGGNKTDVHPVLQALAQAGFVAASVQYRLAPTHQWPAQIEDCKCAVRHLRSRAKELNFDPQKVASLGFSAGGHLSLLLGLTDAGDGLEGKGHNDQSSKVQCVVNYFGPTDFPTFTIPAELDKDGKIAPRIDDLLVKFLGTSDRKAEVMKKVSPIRYIKKECPPILTLHGTLDPIVPVQQAKDLDAALQKAGVSHRLELVDKAGHGWGGPELARTNLLMIEFLNKHLKKN